MSGQAWFDGHTSIRTWLNPEIAFPFWALTYWAEMLDACESKDAWLRAEFWLNRTGKTEEEKMMSLAVRGLWNGLVWHGQLQGFGGIQIVSLAALFSTEYLGSDIVDALIALLSFRLQLSEDPKSGNTLLADTTFAAVVQTLLPIVDGVATGQITSSTSGQKYLRKYGAWSQQQGHQHLHLVLHRPPNHWTACSVDFDAHRIRYGDSLKWTRPKEFFDAIGLWLKSYHSAERTVDNEECKGDAYESLL
ncbi:hypothetical protein B0H17DRAFT_1078976 [Mycena rosella]|uniref:Ubiquitin-like protease family profile domain-containing protein n=1 Tax=Mycena rosella TaxID=1033263 RepID=A0AAD7G8P0_MYCRO|nr:hypothetical protein B0H17DRAFT_1078976 [Mycena rosella]